MGITAIKKHCNRFDTDPVHNANIISKGFGVYTIPLWSILLLMSSPMLSLLR
jgi:hypothetical protein